MKRHDPNAKPRTTPLLPRIAWTRPLRWAAAILALGVVATVVWFAWVVGQLERRHAVGPAWTFPSRLYTAGFDLIGGRECPPWHLREQLEARGYRETRGTPRRPGTYRFLEDGVEIVLRGFLDARDPAGFGGPEHVSLRFSQGRIGAIRRYGGVPGAPPPDSVHAPRLEPVAFSFIADSNRVMREWVPIARMPSVLLQAVVAAEDRRFYQHHGLDPRGGLRALLVNVRAGGVREGASTLSQQLARGLFLGNARNVSRKLNEMLLAVGLDLMLGKRRVLEMYLNSVYLGRDEHGDIAGVAEGARRFFGVPVDSLTLEQATLLVGVIPAPNAFSPVRNPDAALRRRRAVLHDMLETGVIDSTTARAAARASMRLARDTRPAERFPAMASAVRQQLTRQFPRRALEGWGLAIFTTVDPVQQALAERDVAEGVEALDPRPGRGRMQAACVLLDPATAEVRAMVGSRDSEPGAFNRATQARRQPGSSIKPIVYASALDPARRGRRFTPASTVRDLRRTFGRGNKAWAPSNSSRRYHASITLAKALALSQNLATANLVDSIGPAAVARAIERFGLGRPPEVLSLGLGTFEVSPLAMASAYATLGNGGVRREPTCVRAVVDGSGRPLRLAERRAVRVIDETTAAQVVNMLQGVVEHGISRPLRTSYGFDRPVGGKTGTTNDNRDAWYCGLTPQLAAAVWVGYDTPRPLPRAAAGMALPVWARVMGDVLDGFPADEFPIRSDLVAERIDAYTGLKAVPGCAGVITVMLRASDPPIAACNRDHTRERWRTMVQALMDSLVASEGGDTAIAEPAEPDSAVGP